MNNKNQMKSVDIIIPVYNALDDLKICLDSLKKYTDLELNRVIIINDNSPDPNVKIFLDGLNYPWLKVVHSPRLCRLLQYHRSLPFCDILYISDKVYISLYYYQPDVQ